ncbi:hypothetical protein F4782DRAFT_545783 [Xylaria castorea]|nr:hypothetical protein F4782DRAFT_545783 [Xylaria castorea]
MDKDWQDALFEGWADSDVVLRRRDSNDTTRTGPLPVKTSSHSPRDTENESLTTVEKSKGDGGPDGETGMRTEPPSPQPRTPLKKRPAASARPSSVEIFQSPVIDDDDNDDGKSKKSRASVGDNSSVYTVDSADERRLSDKVRKAWRGVTGQQQRLADPLEQWMVKHSGGTLRDAPVRRPLRESSDRR